MATSSFSLPRRSGDVLLIALPDGESVLLDLHTEAHVGLDELGTAVWDALAGDGDLEELIAHVRADAGVESDGMRADIEALIDELSARGLVTDEAEPPSIP